MKIYQVQFDTNLVTLIVEDRSEIFKYLQESTMAFSQVGDKIFIKWDENYTEECGIREIINERGVIQWESH